MHAMPRPADNSLWGSSQHSALRLSAVGSVSHALHPLQSPFSVFFAAAGRAKQLSKMESELPRGIRGAVRRTLETDARGPARPSPLRPAPLRPAKPHELGAMATRPELRPPAAASAPASPVRAGLRRRARLARGGVRRARLLGPGCSARPARGRSSSDARHSRAALDLAAGTAAGEVARRGGAAEGERPAGAWRRERGGREGDRERGRG